MEQPTAISQFVATVDQQMKETKLSIGHMLTQLDSSRDFSASVERVNRMLDEITLQTDLLALSNVLRIVEPAQLGVHAPAA